VLGAGRHDDADRVDVGRDLLIAVGNAHPRVVVCVSGDGLDEDLSADDADLAVRKDVEVVAPGVAVGSSSYAALVGAAEQVLGRVRGNPYECHVGGRRPIRRGVYGADEVGVVATQREQNVICTRCDIEGVRTAAVGGRGDARRIGGDLNPSDRRTRAGVGDHTADRGGGRRKRLAR